MNDKPIKEPKPPKVKTPKEPKAPKPPKVKSPRPEGKSRFKANRTISIVILVLLIAAGISFLIYNAVSDDGEDVTTPVTPTTQPSTPTTSPPSTGTTQPPAPPTTVPPTTGTTTPPSSTGRYVSVESGVSHTCGVTPAGGVECWGYNDFGQIGIPEADTAPYFSVEPVVVQIENVASLSLGANHTCAILETGSIRCWGKNEFGQLGRALPAQPTDSGSGTGQNSPSQRTHLPQELIRPLINVESISVADSANCALYNNVALGVKQVACWGNPNHNILGTTYLGGIFRGERGVQVDASTALIPHIIPQLSGNVKAVSVGGTHACALTANDSVMCWGENFNEELGISLSDIDIAGANFESFPTPQQIRDSRSAPLTNVKAVTSGGRHNCIIIGDDRTVQCWGANQNGQLGISKSTIPSTTNIPMTVPDLGTGIIAIDSTGSWTCAITQERTVKCWGSDFRGQISGITGSPRIGADLGPTEIPGLINIASITLSRTSACAIDTSGTTICFGDDFSGKLGPFALGN